VSEFAVTPETLVSAAAVLGPGGASVRIASAGAAAGTPVAGAWSLLVERADQALVGATEARGDLARALSVAGTAYRIADQSSAAGLHTSG
jgi:hypothetical protein